MTKDSESSVSDNGVIERGVWSRKIEYLLSVLGYIVGLGNLWRFPYICLRNGGGAFLIPFFICLVFCGIPLFFLETAVGQFTGQGTLHVWEVCPIFKGVGVGMLISMTIFCIYYNIIMAWSLYYIASSFAVPLPWTSCNNEWNSEYCTDDRSTLNLTSQVMQGINSTNSTPNWITAQEEFWQEDVLGMSSGIEEIGTINWKLMLCLLGAWVVVGLCIIKGVKSLGKVVYVTATIPYILLTVILVRGLTLDGSIDGIKVYLSPDFSKLLELQVWLEAAIQVFYSLGPGWGPLFTMASFNKFNNNCLRHGTDYYSDSVLLSLAGEGTSLYSGFIIFTVLGFMSTSFSLPIDKLVKSGPGLGFIVYPEALAQLPGQNVWAFIFFVMLLTVGLDSQFAYCEAVIVACTDKFKKLRKRRILFVVAFCIANFLLGLIMVTQGGIFVFQLVDWYIAAFSPAVFGLIECIVFGWIYGFDRFSKDVHLMLGRGIPMFFRICICFITPAILLGLFVYSLTSYKPPSYGSYEYPLLAAVFGTFLSILPLIPIPICAVGIVLHAPGDTLKDKIATALKPTPKWKPVSKELQDSYYDSDSESSRSLIETIKLNVMGRT
ncbi:Sodium- and chloride-dependent GABA transporter 2,Sodium- and chloride-dependent taurine transporter,Sodium-dependent dopamine transporter,Sodium-dependent proline transporter,Sodium-and chloride-dependent glycine transporter 2,Sodium-dependent noradrenaline transporter,Sodium- and chloride-dependent GABA transporter 1,Sodium- and chloride-dependent betaine transporter,Sodium- and chloride-dependent neutral and basic amino acid transporter B(0+),Sodium-dependent neutral amino acid transporter SLC6A17,Sodiu|uniref:Transporter n=1 Tax=Mytilus edulis TaxID=6550 RepID=A0A8S3QW20_MYTED|nr:Sodium- and chloride-dependent GABA transporter 2,Sodium- and chloride-dependent taurine transporter,Sodium-dependent dopamine transporter,Sodium-dependent proline transporter,Sodium-and chloride-dependent glycine transporter 2,Sodium-dependent noradrenaline transporter,Sodium- and chloride-dependent GABA transporter 1,Sodium- and chloride-dependent betaine transporter,Sodium- and chloride-dependent neutral and basic amino acid transporter B(0+),Sodium-dependent neutral amino acid transporter SL